MKSRKLTILSACVALSYVNTHAVQYTLSIDGSDAIFLAGRTDLVIPPASDPWPGGLVRHGGPTPEEILETLPPGITVTAGDTVKVFDPAVGGISFFNGLGAPLFGPDGITAAGSSLTSFGGISGYIGTQGALVGVFLDNSIPSGVPPATLDFSSEPSRNALSYTPELGQVFFIGDGQTSSSEFQSFIAPLGATRLFLGIPDGFAFNGAPGAYDDNDGGYRITIGVNELPTTSVPDGGSTAVLLSAGMGGLLMLRRRR